MNWLTTYHYVHQVNFIDSSNNGKELRGFEVKQKSAEPQLSYSVEHHGEMNIRGKFPLELDKYSCFFEGTLTNQNGFSFASLYMHGCHDSMIVEPILLNVLVDTIS